MLKSERTLEQVEAEIAQVKQELADVHGTETEVYARIVGYYRAVRNWNKGKADEFKLRKNFTLEDSNRFDSVENAAKAAVCAADKSAKAEKTATSVKSETAAHTPASSAKPEMMVGQNQISSYEMFVRKTCPNCPPVKAYMANLKLEGNIVDVDTTEGLNTAALKGVFAAPTVIVYNPEGKEIARAHSVDELTAIFEPAVVLA